MIDQPLLHAKNIKKSFSTNTVLNKVQFDLNAGEVHALLGANGAGKSTLIKILTAAYAKDDGELYLKGEKVQFRTPIDANKAGICAVYQEFSLINDLNVGENIFLGRLTKDKKSYINWHHIHQEAQKVLKELGSTIHSKTLVNKLSVAEKQIVEIAKALSFNAKILILDEPTASLSDKDVSKLFDVIRTLTKKGIGIIYVSHRLEELPQIADRVTIFKDGQYIITLPIEEAPKDVIIHHMVGKSIHNQEHQKRDVGEVIFSAKNLSAKGLFSDISFDLHKGEILGLTGLAGARRTELARAIFGVENLDSGSIFFEGKEVIIKTPKMAKNLGIGFITEDRKEEGLVLSHSIGDNINITILDKLKKWFYIPKQAAVEISENYIRDLSIKCHGRKQQSGDLSGGNQQKVVVAKWMATKPKMLIMDEPTRGVDVGAKSQIYALLKALSDNGVAILMISSEIPEILDLSDNIMVMSAGSITYNDKNQNTITQDDILHYATIIHDI